MMDLTGIILARKEERIITLEDSTLQLRNDKGEVSLLNAAGTTESVIRWEKAMKGTTVKQHTWTGSQLTGEVLRVLPNGNIRIQLLPKPEERRQRIDPTQRVTVSLEGIVPPGVQSPYFETYSNSIRALIENYNVVQSATRQRYS